MELKIIEVLPAQGGRWETFVPLNYQTVHAVKFSDGRIWDTYNGWRRDIDPFPSSSKENRLEALRIQFKYLKERRPDVMTSILSTGEWFIELSELQFQLAELMLKKD